MMAPPPKNDKPVLIRFLSGLAVIGSLAAILAIVLGLPKLLFLGQMSIFTASICLIPTAAQSRFIQYRGQQYGDLLKVLVEIILFIVLFISFGFWFFGKEAIGIWITYIGCLILLLEIGGHLIERYMVKILRSISRNDDVRIFRDASEAVRKMFQGELILYLSVPLGLAIGTFIGLILDWKTRQIIVLNARIVLSLSSFALLTFLLIAFMKMCDPLLRESDTASSYSYIEEQPVRENGGVLNRLLKVLRLVVPKRQDDSRETQKQKDISLVQMAMSIRKIYLFDSIHNVILLVAFSSGVLILGNVEVEKKWIVATLVGLSIILIQLPFMIGQYRLQQKLLNKYDNEEDISEALKQKAPLAPRLEFLSALISPSTGGYILFSLFEDFVKETLKS